MRWLGAALLRAGVMAACLLPLAALFVLYATVVAPFEPYTFVGYEAEPPELCAGEPVTVLVEREIESGFGVYEVEVTTGWISADEETEEGQMLRSGEVTDTISADDQVRDETQIVESPLLREAPSEPGEWRITSDYIIRGELWGIPRSQELTGLVSDQSITVLPVDHPQCGEDGMASQKSSKAVLGI